MYTQCPECNVAFRVTADVLKQAAGKVRCGGCSVPFNALEHLSEEKPQDRTRREPEAPVAELTAELPVDPDDLKPPRSISAEQSAALLKTLDQLAGEDIRIEDTGVEWRVLDVDEYDDDVPDVIDAREEPEAEPEPEQSAATEELRFDDNTPLPDDFDLDSDPAYSAPMEPPAVEVVESPAKLDIGQVDLAFGDPDEWEDLLGEVVEAHAEEAEEDVSLAAEVDDARPEVNVPEDNEPEDNEPEDNEPEADVAPLETATDEPLDMDTQFALQAEALGVDLSGLHQSIEHEPIEEIELEAPTEDDLAETSIDEDLIAAAFDAEATARKEVSAAEELLEELANADIASGISQDLDEMPEVEESAEVDAAAELSVEESEAEGLDLDAIEIELSADDHGDVETGAPEIDEADLEAVLAMAAEDALEEAETEIEEASALELAAEIEAAFEGENLGEEPGSNFEEGPVEEQAEDEGHHVPEQTEEEMTINMMIDQDLLAIAVEDDDGFTSTIVQKQVSSKHDIPAENSEPDTDAEVVAEEEPEIAEAPLEFGNALVETIIMEGESFRGELDEEQEAAKADLMAQAREAVSNHDHGDQQHGSSTSIGLIAGIVLLLLFLAAQVLHQYRDELATVPAFNNSIAPIYRSIGRPITPAWSVGGWRIEASKGSADEGNQELTIYSRVGNISDSALPYPLMHISLTDRFAETIGSRVLEPAEYLSGDLDPRKTIAPGETFNAVITVQSPSPDSTGYDLKPCYRVEGGRLRCKIEDFR